ncbi:hypothetical protein BJ741DRAFT_615592 [Chytriomyces cf. hyalinus JEL632]|nr:hypothetical protein BJ741DRAFT_615592 [Chytriomyces cf. hyalinus JEL632]
MTQVREQIFFILGMFLVLGMQNSIAVVKRYIDGKRNSVDALMVVASLAQLGDFLFLASFIGFQASAFGKNCYAGAVGGSVLYFVFQIVSTTILIIRATILLKGHMQLAARIMGFVVLFASVASNVIGTVQATAVIDADGFCSVDFDWHNTNNIAKYILTGLYASLLIAFMVPVAKHMSVLEGSNAAEKLRRIATSFGGRVSWAIIGFLLPVFFPYIFANNSSFAGLQAVGFIIQNYFGLLAATIVDDSEKKEAKPDLAQKTSAMERGRV